MQQQNRRVIEYRTNKQAASLTGYVSAKEISDLVNVKAERLLELANLGYAPHVRVDGGEPLFRKVEIREWIEANLVAKCSGQSIPMLFDVKVKDQSAMSPIPPPLHVMLPNLREYDEYPPCVYFLIENDQVVYVGATVKLANRLSEHVQLGKQWARVLYIPVPIRDMFTIEAYWIRLLAPPLNSKNKPWSLNKQEQEEKASNLPNTSIIGVGE